MCEQVKRITELITGQDVNKNNVDTELPARVAEEDLKADDGIDESDLWLVKYDDLAQKSAHIVKLRSRSRSGEDQVKVR